MKNKAVFLDRDGTINEEMGYINHLSRFRIFPFTAKAIALLRENGYKVIVVTNQAGVARGYFTEERVREVHLFLQNRLSKENAQIDKIYYCPHHPTEGNGKYRKTCICRKPNTGMISKAVEDFDIDLSSSYMIGDRYKDVLFAHKVGLKSIMVLTGYGKGEYTYQRDTWERKPDFLCENLLIAAQYICEQKQRSE